jgi:hypothetical protein
MQLTFIFLFSQKNKNKFERVATTPRLLPCPGGTNCEERDACVCVTWNGGPMYTLSGTRRVQSAVCFGDVQESSDDKTNKVEKKIRLCPGDFDFQKRGRRLILRPPRAIILWRYWRMGWVPP